MSLLLEQINQRLAEIISRLNQWEQNAKKTSEFEALLTANPDALIRVQLDGESKKIPIGTILSAIPSTLPDGVTVNGTIDREESTNNFTFTGFTARINSTLYSNASPIERTIAEADEGFKRIDIAIMDTLSNISIIQGVPDEDVAIEPTTPPSTVKLRQFLIDADVVTLGPGVGLPFDMLTLDELIELHPNAYVWVNVDGLDLRFNLNELVSEPINQNNIPKKITFTFNELELENTATHEEIIEAVKVANVGLVVTDTDLVYIEVIQEDFNFDVELTSGYSWEDLLSITDQSTFEDNFLLPNGFSSYTISDFDLTGNRIRCNISSITGSAEVILSEILAFTVHNLNLNGLNRIELAHSSLIIENIRFKSGLQELQILGLNTEIFDYELPSSIRSIYLSDSSSLRKFTSQLPAELELLVFSENNVTTADYEEMEEWANNLPTFISCAMNFSSNVNSITGTNLEAILISKNATITA